MSLQAMVKAIKAKDLTPTEKLVLICLANYANEDGQAWPRQATIADECGLSRETVLRTYKGLEQKGVITSERRTNEAGTDIAKMVRLFPDSVTQDHTRVTENHTGCDAGSQGSVTQDHTYIDKPINSNRVIEPSDLGPSPFDEFWRAYPNKTGKKPAKLVYDKLIRTHPPNEILDGLFRAIARDRRFRDLKFTPHPKSWLNSEGWNDEHPDENNTSNRDQSAGRSTDYMREAIDIDQQRRGAQLDRASGF